MKSLRSKDELEDKDYILVLSPKSTETLYQVRKVKGRIKEFTFLKGEFDASFNMFPIDSYETRGACLIYKLTEEEAQKLKELDDNIAKNVFFSMHSYLILKEMKKNKDSKGDFI
jgi:hypothetical protein